MSRKRVVVCLGSDIGDPALARRIRGLSEAGAEVHAFAFDRSGMKSVEDVRSLGTIRDGSIGGRFGSLFFAAVRLARYSRSLNGVSVIYCRNLDLAILGFWLRMYCQSPRLVYEILDIHPVMFKRSFFARFLRFVERLMLSKVWLLVVSSEDFLRHHFRTVQGFSGRHFVMENKVSGSFCIRPCRSQRSDGPFVIGYFGKLRCDRSLRILSNLARRFPDIVRVRIAGTAIPEVQSALRELLTLPNTEDMGSYVYPCGLADIYRGVDFNWGFDFFDTNNARLLIPNRVYEGGASGVPMLAEAGTATGDYISAHKLGITFGEPVESNLFVFIDNLRSEDIGLLAENVRSSSDDRFFAKSDHEDLLEVMMDFEECGGSYT